MFLDSAIAGNKSRGRINRSNIEGMIPTGLKDVLQNKFIGNCFPSGIHIAKKIHINRNDWAENIFYVRTKSPYYYIFLHLPPAIQNKPRL